VRLALAELLVQMETTQFLVALSLLVAVAVLEMDFPLE
jgi:hypothetical protein